MVVREENIKQKSRLYVDKDIMEGPYTEGHDSDNENTNIQPIQESYTEVSCECLIHILSSQEIVMLCCLTFFFVVFFCCRHHHLLVIWIHFPKTTSLYPLID